MAQVHEEARTVQTTPRAPNTHSEAVQEAKRRQKLQTISSSHRFAEPAPVHATAKDGSP